MGLICNCPLGEALPDVPVYDCPESFGQILKVLFQRLESAAGKKNEFVADTNDITEKASWTAFLTANDGTKIVPSPTISEPTTEPGAARTYGGGNATPGGIEIVIGREPTPFNGKLLQQKQSTIKALKAMQCEGAMGIYVVDENGYIGAIADNPETPTKYTPIPIYGLYVSDKNFGGLEEPDRNNISWKFMPNWSDNLVKIKPSDFNALTDLKKTE